VDIVPLIEPLHTLGPLELGVDAIHAIATNPAGPSVFVLATRDVLDLVLVWRTYWPWALSLTAMLLILAAALFIRRVHARPQVRAKLYCRRCNYDLSSHRAPDAPCPECGSPVSGKGSVSGRSHARRALPALVPIAAVAIAAAVLTVVVVRRTPATCPRSASGWLDRQIRALGVTLPADVVRSCPTIEEIDCATGRVFSTSIMDCEVEYARAMAITPDGRTAVFLHRRAGSLVRVATGSGRIMNVLPVPNEVRDAIERYTTLDGVPGFAGFSDDGAEAFLYGVDDSKSSDTRVLRWRFADNSLSEVVRLPTTDHAIGTPMPHLVRTIPRTDHLLALSSYEPTCTIVQDGQMRTFALPADLGAMSQREPLLIPGSDLVLFQRQSETLTGVAVSSGDGVGAIAIPDRVFLTEFAVADHEGRRIAAGGRLKIAIRDIQTKTWIASLNVLPLKGRVRGISFAGGGDYLVGTTRFDLRFTRPFPLNSADLIIWKINPALIPDQDAADSK
jgi:hypothetical protein